MMNDERGFFLEKGKKIRDSGFFYEKVKNCERRGTIEHKKASSRWAGRRGALFLFVIILQTRCRRRSRSASSFEFFYETSLEEKRQAERMDEFMAITV